MEFYTLKHRRCEISVEHKSILLQLECRRHDILFKFQFNG